MIVQCQHCLMFAFRVFLRVSKNISKVKGLRAAARAEDALGRDICPESHITKYTSTRRLGAPLVLYHLSGVLI